MAIPKFPRDQCGPQAGSVRYLPFGPAAYGPTDIHDYGVYVETMAMHHTPYGYMMHPVVHRVTNISIRDPKLVDGFNVLPQWSFPPSG